VPRVEEILSVWAAGEDSDLYSQILRRLRMTSLQGWQTFTPPSRVTGMHANAKAQGYGLLAVGCAVPSGYGLAAGVAVGSWFGSGAGCGNHSVLTPSAIHQFIADRL